MSSEQEGVRIVPRGSKEGEEIVLARLHANELSERNDVMVQ